MSKKLFVGNLPFSASEEGVRELFVEYGEVNDLTWITDRDTGRFRGFCFVEMDQTAAESAIAALDGQDFDGRSLRVNEAEPRENRSNRSSSGNRGGNNSGGGNQNRNRW